MKQAPANHRVLLMDYYALTMAQSHFSQGRQHEIAYFDYFFRTVPDHGGYAIFAGLTQVLDYLEFLHFTPDDIAFLRSKGVFTAEFLDYLANFRFRGDVRAVPEGSVIFPHEPLLTVRAPLIDCCSPSTTSRASPPKRRVSCMRRRGGRSLNLARAAPTAAMPRTTAPAPPTSAASPRPPTPTANT